MDEDALVRLLQDLQVGLLWTVLAERGVLGDWSESFCGAKHISMVMHLSDKDVRVRRPRGEHVLPDRTTIPI